ncbi:MAG: anti-sigma factor antagonist [Clostridia bacterium]|nr:anti-sigma factor antagonist [Clostridia bacterium]
MGVTCTGEGRALTISLSGEVDHHGARSMMLEMDREIEMELPKALTVDLGGVTFMDSSGIAVLLRAYRRMAELGGSLVVKNIPAQSERMLRASGVDRILKFE